jgi:hypothetical protein
MGDPVDDQMDAYNAHDLERFVACYSRDVVIYNADGTVLSDGLDQVRNSYRAAFAEYPDLCAKAVSRVRAGDWIVSEERAFRRNETLHVLVAYQTDRDRIRRVIMLD